MDLYFYTGITLALMMMSYYAGWYRGKTCEMDDERLDDHARWLLYRLHENGYIKVKKDSEGVNTLIKQKEDV